MPTCTENSKRRKCYQTAPHAKIKRYEQTGRLFYSKPMCYPLEIGAGDKSSLLTQPVLKSFSIQTRTLHPFYLTESQKSLILFFMKGCEIVVDAPSGPDAEPPNRRSTIIGFYHPAKGFFIHIAEDNVVLSLLLCVFLLL